MEVPGGTWRRNMLEHKRIRWDLVFFLNKKQPPSMQRYHENWCSTKNMFFRGQLLVDPWMNQISWYFRCWALTALRNSHLCVLSIFFWGVLWVAFGFKRDICWDIGDTIRFHIFQMILIWKYLRLCLDLGLGDAWHYDPWSYPGWMSYAFKNKYPTRKTMSP